MWSALFFLFVFCVWAGFFLCCSAIFGQQSFQTSCNNEKGENQSFSVLLISSLIKPILFLTASLNSDMCFSNLKYLTTQSYCQNKLANLWIQCSDLNVLPPTGLLQLLTNNIRSRPDVRVTCRRTKYPLYEIASVIWRAHRARAKYEDCSICGVGGGGGACYPTTPCTEG